MRLPILGWEICYATKDGELIVANSAELLKSVLGSATKKPLIELPVEAIDDFTVVRFDQRKSAFDDIMKTLDKDGALPDADSKKLADAFFSGNIGSLLDVASGVRRIEIARRSSSNGLHVEIHFVLHPSG